MTEHNLLVSVVTPCFNSEKTIRKTMESVINQTYKNIEYIIIDGQSSDSTLDIINEYIKENLNIMLVSETDSGVYDAMNKGIALSKGRLIGIINSDDWYEKDAIEQIVNSYSGEKYTVLYGFTRYWEGEKEDKIALYSHNSLAKQMISHPATFVTRETYDMYGKFDLAYKCSADYDLMLRLSKKNVQFIPVYSLIANFSSGGISSSYVGAKETASILHKYGIISKKKRILSEFTIWLHSIYKKLKRIR